MEELERMAKTATELNSFSDYKEGSASAELSALIEGARKEAEEAKAKAQTNQQKEAIEDKLNRYEKGLASWYLSYYANEASCPSIMICGGANFPTRKKEAQNSRRSSLSEERNRLDELRASFGSSCSVISSGDPEAVKVLTRKIEALKASHAIKIRANAFYRKNKTLIGFPEMSEEKAKEWQARHDSGDCFYREPFPSFDLTNENAEIKRLEGRLSSIEAVNSDPCEGWAFDGGTIEIDRENSRIAVLWDEPKRGRELEEVYKANGDNWNVPRLLWSPSFNRWQCLLSEKNIRALKNSATYAPNDETSKKARAEEKELAEAVKQAEEKDEKEGNYTAFGSFAYKAIVARYGFGAYYKREIEKGLEKHPTAKPTKAGSVYTLYIDEGKIVEATEALKAYVAEGKKD